MRTIPYPVTVCLLALALAGPLAAQPNADPAPLIGGFFAALYDEDPAALSNFIDENMSDGFKASHSREANEAFRDRLRNDLGKLTVDRIEVISPAKVTVDADSEFLAMSVRFGFDLANGKIDSISVRIGGPPGGRAPMLELPKLGNDASFSTALDEQLQILTQQGRFSGVVLLARDAEPIFHRGYGLANREEGRRVSTDTRFDVGSITKLLTRIAIAQLARQGKLELDDTIAAFLPDYPQTAVANVVTIQHLLDHTSGLGDIFNERWGQSDRKKFTDPTDFFALFADEPLAFDPGSRHSYSNAGFIVLGAVIEAASSMSYSDYVAKHIFAPADMKRSGFLPRDGSLADVAIGYTRGGPTGGNVHAGGETKPNLGMLPPYGCPAGSSSHTGEDLLSLDKALRSGKLLDSRWTAWLFRSESVLDDAIYAVGVAGGGPGVSAGLESNGRATAIVLSNLDPPSGAALAVELFRALERSER